MPQMGHRQNFAIALFVTVGLCAAGVIFVAQRSTAAQQAPAVQQQNALGAASAAEPPKVIIHALNKRVYWVEGPGPLTRGDTNDGIIVGDNGVILFDTKSTIDAEKAVIAEIEKITSKPVTHIIISDSDGDKLSGLPAFPKGLTIIAQENCKKEMEDSAAEGGRGAASPDYLPTKSIDKDETLTIDGVRVRLLHWAPAHSDGEVAMYLPDDKIVFTGDLLLSHYVALSPTLHMDKGGSATGWVASMEGLSALDADTFIAGHGDVVNKAEMVSRTTAAEQEMARVKPLVQQGKSLAEIKQTLEETTPYTAPGGRGPRLSLVDYIYEEITNTRVQP